MFWVLFCFVFMQGLTKSILIRDLLSLDTPSDRLDKDFIVYLNCMALHICVT